jgi:hypothetical protein
MPLIDIGSTKQLFLDDYLIESMANVKQVLNPAVKVDNNPVIKSERPWEGNNSRPLRVLYEEDEGLFKMWYSSFTLSLDPNMTPGGYSGIVMLGEDDPPVTCLATSEDGIHWERPDLGLVEFQGSKHNNILPPTEVGAPQFKDPVETDPARRYKHLNWTKDTKAPMKASLYHSPDGFDWTPYSGNPVMDTTPVIGRWGPTHVMGWDSIRETYAAYVECSHHMRAPFGKRIIGRAESPDMVNWTEAEAILIPDELDFPDTEFYLLHVLPYEGLYVGLLWIFRTTNLTHHPELVVSRDGFHFERNFREPFIYRGGRRVDFDHGSVYLSDAVVHGDEVFFYYIGTNRRSPEQMRDLGDDSGEGVGMAVSRLDGFVSVDGGKGWVPHNVTQEQLTQMRNRDHLIDISKGAESFGQLVTRSFGFSGSQLHLNSTRAPIAAGPGIGEIRVELLTFNHRKIEGFTFDDADPIMESGLDQVVSWNDDSDLSRLAGQPIKLRFYIKNAKLYSFQFR